MNTIFSDIDKINWRYFPLFLIIVLLVGLLSIYLLIPSVFSKEEIKKIPIIIDQESEKVESYKFFLQGVDYYILIGGEVLYGD